MYSPHATPYAAIAAWVDGRFEHRWGGLRLTGEKRLVLFADLGDVLDVLSAFLGVTVADVFPGGFGLYDSRLISGITEDLS